MEKTMVSLLAFLSFLPRVLEKGHKNNYESNSKANVWFFDKKSSKIRQSSIFWHFLKISKFGGILFRAILCGSQGNWLVKVSARVIDITCITQGTLTWITTHCWLARGGLSSLTLISTHSQSPFSVSAGTPFIHWHNTRNSNLFYIPHCRSTNFRQSSIRLCTFSLTKWIYNLSR